jgi:hypothetical protein
MKVDWTQEMKDELVNLTNDSHCFTYKEIARAMSAKFGVTFTKNSLIGKAARLKLPPRNTPEPKMENDMIMPANAILNRRRGPITIYQLRDDRCKWPIGNKPPYLYCGKATGEIGCSWCEEHRRKVFGRFVQSAG